MARSTRRSPSRGSRLALYDLRDSLLETERLPVAFLAALEEVGDASCLEPLAAAYDASPRGSDPWWRDHLADGVPRHRRTAKA